MGINYFIWFIKWGQILSFGSFNSFFGNKVFHLFYLVHLVHNSSISLCSMYHYNFIIKLRINIARSFLDDLILIIVIHFIVLCHLVHLVLHWPFHMTLILSISCDLDLDLILNSLNFDFKGKGSFNLDFMCYLKSKKTNELNEPN